MKVPSAHTGSMWRDDSPTYVASSLTFISCHQVNMNAIKFNFCKTFHLVHSDILIKEGENLKILILYILNTIIANRIILKI